MPEGLTVGFSGGYRTEVVRASAIINEILDRSWLPAHFDEEPKKCVIDLPYFP
jgi:hypothetical protein